MLIVVVQLSNITIMIKIIQDPRLTICGLKLTEKIKEKIPKLF